MAFIGKKQHTPKAKAPVVVSIHNGRIGIIVRGGIVAPGTKLDVLVGTEEDHGLIKVVASETGTACRAFGKKGTTISWSGFRAAAKALPELRRSNAEIAYHEPDEVSFIVALPYHVPAE